MKIFKYKKCKSLISINIILLLYYFSRIRLFYITDSVNNEYSKIEKYLKICTKLRHINITKITELNTPKISLISPVYNTGRFVLRFLRSIQFQKFNDIEIILIDDFSKDNSVQLIKEYQNEDKRIKLIRNKKNKGTFSSRNIGILKSKGEYIMMPDPDDILLENSLEYFYNFAKKYNYELIRFNIYLNFGKSFFGQITRKLESRSIFQPELSTYLFYGLKYLHQVDFNICNKFIKREAIIRALKIISINDLNIYMTCHEDGLLNFLLYRTAKSFYFIKKFGYYYIMNNYKHRKYFTFNNIKFSFIHIMNIFNLTKNSKKEKDMVNEIFKRLVYKKKLKNRLYLIKRQPNFFINSINALKNNEFISFKYKKYLNFFLSYFKKHKKK